MHELDTLASFDIAHLIWFTVLLVSQIIVPRCPGMAAGAVSLRKSHDIVILSFCDIVIDIDIVLNSYLPSILLMAHSYFWMSRRRITRSRPCWSEFLSRSSIRVSNPRWFWWSINIIGHTVIVSFHLHRYSRNEVESFWWNHLNSNVVYGKKIMWFFT